MGAGERFLAGSERALCRYQPQASKLTRLELSPAPPLPPLAAALRLFDRLSTKSPVELGRQNLVRRGHVERLRPLPSPPRGSLGSSRSHLLAGFCPTSHFHGTVWVWDRGISAGFGNEELGGAGAGTGCLSQGVGFQAPGTTILPPFPWARRTLGLGVVGAHETLAEQAAPTPTRSCSARLSLWTLMASAFPTTPQELRLYLF